MGTAYTCITCPQSCDLVVSEDGAGGLAVTGNKCKRGIDYAVNEHRSPKRMLTTTMPVVNATQRRLPVISSGPVPREKLGDCLGALYRICVHGPVKMGDVIVSDLLGTGVDILAARNLDALEREE